MPIDPKQLAAFSHDTASTAASTGASDGTETAELEPAAPVHATPEEQEKKLAHLILILSHAGDDLQGFVDEVDADLLTDLSAELPPEEAEAIEEAISALPSAVRSAIADVGAISDYDASFVADELQGQELIDDTDTFAGWLQRASQVIMGTLPHEEEEESGTGEDTEDSAGTQETEETEETEESDETMDSETW